jgi:hypothetical protein
MKPLLLVPVLVLAACATRTALDDSHYYQRLGDHLRAYQVLDNLRNEQLASNGSVDATLEQEHQRAYLAYLCARAEQNIFEEREERALGDLAELDTIAPGYPGVEALRERALRKRAARLVTEGGEELRRKDYVHALARFEQGRAIDPTSVEAKEGIKAVYEATERMGKRAQEQFLEAVRKLPELRFVEVQWHTTNALHNTPDAEDAKQLQDKARYENAQSAVARAQAAEREAKFGAALIEYREAQRFDPKLPGIDAAIAGMEREVKAAALIDKSQIAMRAARFDIAREQLGEAFELSLMARNDIAKLVRETRHMEGDHQYRAARDLEVLGKKAEALAAFEALAKDWPDGLADEHARIEGLRVDIAGAATEWAAAEAAEAANEPAKALEHYRNADRFYPGYKDGKERIERLRAVLEPPGGNAGGNGGAGTSGG